MRKLYTFAAVTVMLGLASLRGQAQFLEPRFAVHFSSPVGLLSKFGFKGEFRINPNNAVLAGYTQYWGYFPGTQGMVEFRRYAYTRSLMENFLYGKLGTGYAGYEHLSFLQDDAAKTYKAPGSYYFVGGGAGRHFNYGAFFLDINAGLKLTILGNRPPIYNERMFFISGPASVLDLNLHLGFQF